MLHRRLSCRSFATWGAAIPKPLASEAMPGVLGVGRTFTFAWSEPWVHSRAHLLPWVQSRPHAVLYESAFAPVIVSKMGLVSTLQRAGSGRNSLVNALLTAQGSFNCPMVHGRRRGPSCYIEQIPWLRNWQVAHNLASTLLSQTKVISDDICGGFIGSLHSNALKYISELGATV